MRGGMLASTAIPLEKHKRRGPHSNSAVEHPQRTLVHIEQEKRPMRTSGTFPLQASKSHQSERYQTQQETIVAETSDSTETRLPTQQTTRQAKPAALSSPTPPSSPLCLPSVGLGGNHPST